MARLVRKLLSTKVNCFTLTRSSFSNRHKGTFLFYDRKTLHCDKFLVNKTNRRTEFQFYWYYDSTCFGQPFRPSSGVRNRKSALVHFADLMNVCYHVQDGSILHLVANGYQICKMYQCPCTAENPWWWAERLPETCRVVILIKLEFSAAVGFIH